MANSEHLDLLKQGAEVWNRWRLDNEGIRPDLSGVDLSGADLSGVNLSRTDLSGANLLDSECPTPQQIQAAFIDGDTKLHPDKERARRRTETDPANT